MAKWAQWSPAIGRRGAPQKSKEGPQSSHSCLPSHISFAGLFWAYLRGHSQPFLLTLYGCLFAGRLFSRATLCPIAGPLFAHLVINFKFKLKKKKTINIHISDQWLMSRLRTCQSATFKLKLLIRHPNSSKTFWTLIWFKLSLSLH